MNSFIEWYQHLPLHIDPNIFTIFGFGVRWYSLSYILAIGTVYLLVYRRWRREPVYQDYSKKLLEDSLVYAILGIIVGARMGFVLFYDFSEFLTAPWKIFMPVSCEGGFHVTGIQGMSYHGGAIGVVIAFLLFAKKRNISFFRFLELFLPIVPLGYTFGRLGNFMNGELYGRVTAKAWGMYFYTDAARTTPYEVLRHPSQLYEAFFEGIFLFSILWFLRKKMNKPGLMTAAYLIGHGLLRFLIEFVRQPDELFRDPGERLGTVIGIFTMGQVLCALMILSGAAIIYFNQRKND